MFTYRGRIGRKDIKRVGGAISIGIHHDGLVVNGDFGTRQVVCSGIMVHAIGLTIIIRVTRRACFGLCIGFALVASGAQTTSDTRFMVVYSTTIYNRDITLGVYPLTSIGQVLVFGTQQDQETRDGYRVLPCGQAKDRVFFATDHHCHGIHQGTLVGRGSGAIQRVTLGTHFVGDLGYVDLVTIFNGVRGTTIRLLGTQSIIVMVYGTNVTYDQRGCYGITTYPLTYFAMEECNGRKLVTISVYGHGCLYYGSTIFTCCNGCMYAIL